MKKRYPKTRVVHMRHPKLTRLVSARLSKGKSAYVTRPHRFRHF